MLIVKLGCDLLIIATGLKGGVELLDYQESTESKLYKRVYKDEILRIINKASSTSISNLNQTTFMKYYRQTINKNDVVDRPSQTDGLQAQIEYALEERNLGEYGHMRMHALHWAVKDYKQEFEKIDWQNQKDFLYEKYGEFLYKQYKKRF